MLYFGPYWGLVKFALAVAFAVPAVVLIFALLEGSSGYVRW